jgi:hypothetical protein
MVGRHGSIRQIVDFSAWAKESFTRQMLPLLWRVICDELG